VDLSVVVLSWNTADLTVRALRAAKDGAAGVAAELLCVDNGSTDGSPDLVRRSVPDALVVENGSNLGFARGNDRALPHVRGRYVCFLNSDAAPKTGALAHVVRWLDEHRDVGVAAPSLVSPDGSPQRTARGPATAPALLHRYTALGYQPFGRGAARRWERPDLPGAEPVDVDSLMGACLVVRADLLRRLGGFDEGYFFYWEDVDLCLRAKRLGARVTWVRGGPEVVHEGGAATKSGGGPPRLSFAAGLLRYQRKVLSPLAWAAFATAFVPGYLLRAAVESLRLSAQAAGRFLGGRREDAAKSLRAAGGWARLLERDALALLRLLGARPPRP
jgi:GT2 family glycosyltransferase